jgi:hypothetical protein
MQKYVGPKWQLDKNALEDYTVRNNHPQFEDSEAAAMALYYVLRSQAGLNALYEIMNGWFWNASWTRASIYSKTGLNGLLQGPIAPPKPNNDQSPSAHPLRGKEFQMVQRPKGDANQKPTKVAITHIVTVLDRISTSELRLTTHYPSSKAFPPNGAPANNGGHNCDFVQWKVYTPEYKSLWKCYSSKPAATLKW